MGKSPPPPSASPFLIGGISPCQNATVANPCSPSVTPKAAPPLFFHTAGEPQHHIPAALKQTGWNLPLVRQDLPKRLDKPPARQNFDRSQNRASPPHVSPIGSDHNPASADHTHELTRPFRFLVINEKRRYTRPGANPAVPSAARVVYKGSTLRARDRVASLQVGKLRSATSQGFSMFSS